ncbi:M14 family metallocarboxypeptidase [Bacteroides sp. 51]|uniref:M14 family metallopeptidase n=1 Tax=Bacteroides sp. 51 TaxID=2302938 RepID=UPI0013D047CC|nr:M14 family metallocarboxypeptidase [Bacteroides sp. 51]NDV80714.1 peptidase [Bacteroides sp. 51]
MKKIFVLFVILSVCGLFTALAQQPKKVTEKFFPEPDVEMDIPVFKKKSGYTTYKEMYEFLEARIAEHPELIRMETVGKSQRGRDIPLVTVSRKSDGADKLRIFYYARVHGDEPAGTEGVLYMIRQLAEAPEVNALLDKADFYIMPMVNPDGAESSRRVTANGIDLNRDQSKLDTPEAVVLNNVVGRIHPHIALDFHEYHSIRSDFSQITSDIISTPWDVMFLYSSNPNVPEVLRDLVNDLFLTEAKAELDKNGLTHHTYYTSRKDFGEVYFNVGGASPRSTSSAMALKNTVSVLFEIRGLKLDRVSMKRRTYTAYLLALSFAETALKNEERLRNVLAESQAKRDDIAVSFTSGRKEMSFTFIDIIRNKLVTFDVPARVAEDFTVTMTRPLPPAYYLLPSETNAVEKLKQMGIEVAVLENETTVAVEAYTVTSLKEDGEQVGGVYPVTVKTTLSEREVRLPAGTWRVDTTQPFVRAATVLLEPESANGFVNYRVVKAVLNEEIPIYRAK